MILLLPEHIIAIFFIRNWKSVTFPFVSGFVIGQLYDHCDVDVDCSAVVTNSNCTNNMCLCENGYKAESNNATCTLRKS